MLWLDNYVPMGLLVASAAGFPARELEFTSDCLTWEVEAVFSFGSLDTSFPVLKGSKFLIFCSECPRTARCTRTRRCWRRIDSLRHQLPHWFWFRNHSFIFSWSFLLTRVGWAETARCKLWYVHDVEQTENVVPLCMDEIVIWQDIGKFVLGVNIFDLDLVGPSWFCQMTMTLREVQPSVDGGLALQAWV